MGVSGADHIMWNAHRNWKWSRGSTVKAKGIGACPGKRSGRLYILEEDATISDKVMVAIADCIIAFDGAFSPRRALCARSCIGMLARSGGFTCHAASICRELNIPCVVGLGEAFDILKDGSMLTIDGSTGLVEIEE